MVRCQGRGLPYRDRFDLVSSQSGQLRRCQVRQLASRQNSHIGCGHGSECECGDLVQICSFKSFDLPACQIGHLRTAQSSGLVCRQCNNVAGTEPCSLRCFERLDLRDLQSRKVVSAQGIELRRAQ